MYIFVEHCLAHEIDAGGGSCSKVVKTLDALVSGSWFIYIPLCRHPAQPSSYTTRSCQKGRISNPLLSSGVAMTIVLSCYASQQDIVVGLHIHGPTDRYISCTYRYTIWL